MNNWYLEIASPSPTMVVFVSVLIVLVLQLLLCFNARKTFTKLLPLVSLTILMIVFSVCSAVINGWDGLIYFFFAVLSFGLLFVCGIGWGIWAVFRKRN